MKILNPQIVIEYVRMRDHRSKFSVEIVKAWELLCLVCVYPAEGQSAKKSGLVAADG